MQNAVNRPEIPHLNSWSTESCSLHATIWFNERCDSLIGKHETLTYGSDNMLCQPCEVFHSG